MALLTANVKAAELLSKWDTNSDGQIDKAEAIQGLKDLGVEATDEVCNGRGAPL